MAKPNYAFEKRQRERAKKEKKAEKAAQRKPGDKPDEQPVEGSDAPKDDTSAASAAVPVGAPGR